LGENPSLSRLGIKPCPEPRCVVGRRGFVACSGGGPLDWSAYKTSIQVSSGMDTEVPETSVKRKIGGAIEEVVV
jgi:hypothetical protein